MQYKIQHFEQFNSICSVLKLFWLSKPHFGMKLDE